MKKIFVFNKDENYEALLYESGPSLYTAAKDFADVLRNYVKYDNTLSGEQRHFAELLKEKFYEHYGDVLQRIEDEG